jgi:hypothetical protein
MKWYRVSELPIANCLLSIEPKIQHSWVFSGMQ